MAQEQENVKVETPEAAEAPAAEAPAAEKAPKPKASRTAPPVPQGEHYFWGTGRRKSSVARVRIRPGSGNILINKREVAVYFTEDKDRSRVSAPLKSVSMEGSWDVWVNVKGGGNTGQAGAITLGLARALAKAMGGEDESKLRHDGLMTRDARMKERKKPGQPGARKKFQFSKR